MDCPHDYANPIRKGRARYECRLCGKDISLVIVLIQEATWTQEEIDEAKKKAKKVRELIGWKEPTK